MIIKLTLEDPFNYLETINFQVNYPNVDYGFYKGIKEFYTDEDICYILDNLILDLDCTREISCGRVLMTNYPIYHNRLSNYNFYLLKIQNQFVYNKYLDKLIKRHLDNLIFEYLNPLTKPVIDKHSTKSINKKKVPNKFIKQITNDLYTGEEIYIYENYHTGEVIKSKNPNLLDELNNKPKKKNKKVKTVGVPLDLMTFSFD